MGDEPYRRTVVMKRLIIVVEGQTEQSFIKEILAPYLLCKGIEWTMPVLIRTSRKERGGFVNYQHLYNTIKGLLGNPNDSGIVVSKSFWVKQSQTGDLFHISNCMSLRHYYFLTTMASNTYGTKVCLPKQSLLLTHIQILKKSILRRRRLRQKDFWR